MQKLWFAEKTGEIKIPGSYLPVFGTPAINA
jgi:hypothetical protein